MKEFYPEGWYDTSRNATYPLSLSSVYAAVSSKTVLEAKAVLCDEEHNLTVDLGCMKGIIPRDEGAIGISEGITRDIALISRVGKSVCFTVEEIRNDKNSTPYALLSRKNAQLMCKKEFIDLKTSGDVIDAKITHLETFGAFCDIGCGNIALLPIDAISVSRISHPNDRFSVGDNIKVIIKSVADDGKITLTHKELLGTWEENADLFSVGQTVSGVVRSIEDYGIFVELSANLAGLAEPKENVKVGQRASVYIKSIIPEKMKIKLIIIDCFDADAKIKNNYITKENHIDRWDYSPENCEKKIYSEFG